MTVWIDIAALAVPMLSAGLLGAALRAPLPQAALPALFALMAGSAVLGSVAAAHGRTLAAGAATVGAVAALIALATGVCTRDAQLAAGGGSAELLLAGLPRSSRGRWRKFERDLWAYVAAHARGHAADDA
ncbi:MAG: hypothetical protein JSS99_06590 [Actinobacteria bacterium]|nr:hypothetical protein [Actinomycetota bacterium]